MVLNDYRYALSKDKRRANKTQAMKQAMKSIKIAVIALAFAAMGGCASYYGGEGVYYGYDDGYGSSSYGYDYGYGYGNYGYGYGHPGSYYGSSIYYGIYVPYYRSYGGHYRHGHRYRHRYRGNRYQRHLSDRERLARRGARRHDHDEPTSARGELGRLHGPGVRRHVKTEQRNNDVRIERRDRSARLDVPARARQGLNRSNAPRPAAPPVNRSVPVQRSRPAVSSHDSPPVRRAPRTSSRASRAPSSRSDRSNARSDARFQKSRRQ